MALHNPHRVLRNETRLLLACARVVVDPRAAAHARALIAAGIDWHALLAQARQQRVLPLVARSLQHTLPDAVPPDVLTAWAAESRKVAGRALRLTAELRSVVTLLDAQGIKVLALKGPALAQTFYGSPTLRQFGDLDLLLARADMPRAGAVLARIGYAPRVALTAAQMRAYLRTQYVWSLRRAGSATLELHHDLRPAYFATRFDLPVLWQRAVPLLIGGQTVWQLCPADQLVTLCVHGANHCWERLAWVCDIAELIRACPDLPWSTVLDQARRRGAERMVLLGALLAHRLLDAPVPAAVLACCTADPMIEQLAAVVIDHLDALQPRPLEAVARARFHLHARERRRDRWRYLLHLIVLPTEQDWITRPLPGRLAGVYTWLRPLRIIQQYGLGVQQAHTRR